MPTWVPTASTDYELQKLVKLKMMERNLATMLESIDKEINQTDVEWMHLKSLINSRRNIQCNSQEIVKPSVSEPKLLKIEHHMDDQTINNTQLNLTLGNSNYTASLDQEEDSD